MEKFLTQLFSNQSDNPSNFFLIAGPCVVEGEQLVMDIAGKVSAICKRLEIPYVFKASYRKANRTSAGSFMGIGDVAALELIQKAAAYAGVPCTTDIHAHEEAAMAANHVDVLQIPAFLCRQTDLLVAATKTGKVVNVKKGQFLSGASMKFAVEKIQNSGNHNVILTERGNMFGYQDMVVDYRNLPIMAAHGVPVVMDCTHSLQQPNQPGGVTGANGLFIETHPNPAEAKSDGANMLRLDLLEALLEKLVKLRAAVV
jgi:2-dehydro-3-deoxyphosphooctonate aldolase (KDO 8-P synthase)